MPEPSQHGHGHEITEARKAELAVKMRDAQAIVQRCKDIGHRSPVAADLAKAVLALCEIQAECAGLPAMPPKPPPAPHPGH